MLVAGRPTVRDAELPGGNRMVQEAKAGVPKGGRKPGKVLRPPAAVPDNWPDTGQRARTRKGADVDQVSL